MPFRSGPPDFFHVYTLHLHLPHHSLEIILRAESVEMVQAGDKCDFIGTLIAIPDVAQLAMESEYECLYTNTFVSK